MSTYPSNIPIFPNLTDEVDVVAANDENSARNEIIALCTYIGTNPQGSQGDLTTRIAQMMATNGAVAQGIAYPTNAIEGQLFWRTDLITLYIYGSSNWNSLGQSLSNTIFSFSNIKLNSSTESTLPTFTTTYVLSRFRKISGISTVDINYYVIGVGLSSFTVTAVIGPTSIGIVMSSNAWSQGSLDVSGLTNGSYYDIVLQGNNTGVGATLKAVQLIGH